MIVSDVGRTTSGSGQRAGGHHFAFRVYLQPRVGDDRAFLRETFHMRRLLSK